MALFNLAVVGLACGLAVPVTDFQINALQLPQEARGPFQAAVSLAGRDLVLELAPRSYRAADFRLLVDAGDGRLVPVEPAAPRTFRGSVAGMPGSRAAASLIDGRLWASVVLDDGTAWSVEPLEELLAGAPAGLHAAYEDRDVLPPDRACGTTEAHRVAAAIGAAGGSEGGAAGGTGVSVVEVACEADVEYWLINDGDVQQTMADIENLFSGVELIYENQLDVTFEITTIVVRTGAVSEDPYTTNICGELLEQFREVWRTPPEISIDRDVAHMFTGRGLADCLGIAFVGTVCQGNSGFHYGVVESRAPGLPFTLRKGLSAHELGHNFDASHCCAGCFGCSGCRIMCPCIGDCSGNASTFGAEALAEMQPFVAGLFCLYEQPETIAPPFLDDFPAASIDPAKWSYNDGGTVSSAAGGEPSPPNALLLETDGFGLQYQDHEIRTSPIDLAGMESAGFWAGYWTRRAGVEAGERLIVEYWSGSFFDTWETLEVIVSDGSDPPAFTESHFDLDELDPSPFHGEFRLRFRTDVDQVSDGTDDNWFIDDVFVGGPPAPANDDCAGALVVADGDTPFTTLGATTDGIGSVSCEGSPDLVFGNDVWFSYTPPCTDVATFSTCNQADFDTRIAVYFAGDCPPSTPLECSADAPGCGTTSEVSLLVAGGFEYFLRVGSASGVGSGTLSITCGEAAPCPWDLDGDGTVGITDFLDLLAAWQTDPGGPPDFDGDGTVGITDFLELLSHWGACP